MLNKVGEAKSKTQKNNIFTGEFWAGSVALNLGLIDGIGNADQVLREKFGENVIIKKFEKQKGFGHKIVFVNRQSIRKYFRKSRRKSLWQRFGL